VIDRLGENHQPEPGGDRMIGIIIDYDETNRRGVVRDPMGQEHEFGMGEWRADTIPAVGNAVDFQFGDAGSIRDIYLRVASEQKSRVVAGILGIVLGALGIHKFYLSYPLAGIIMLAITVLGSWLVFPPLLVWFVGIVEGIIYLTRSETEFARTYIIGRREWF
jgi:TM2 domain-containing membrane protein YozV